MITRDEFVKTLKKELDDVNTGIKKVEHKAKSVNEKAQLKLKTRIKYLRGKRDSALRKIREVKNTSEETWLDLKQGTEKVVYSLKTVLDKTLTHFKKKKSDLVTEE